MYLWDVIFVEIGYEKKVGKIVSEYGQLYTRLLGLDMINGTFYLNGLR